MFLLQRKNIDTVKRKIYILDKEKNVRFLDKEIQNPFTYGVYHYLSESFYSILVNKNSRRLDIYSSWYNISKNSRYNISKHNISWPLEHFDERGIRLFYCRHGLVKMDAKFTITPSS